MSLSIDTTPIPEAKEPLSIDTSTAPDNQLGVSVPADVANERAMKFQMAGLKDDQATVWKGLVAGEEPRYRDDLANESFAQQMQRRQGMIMEHLRNNNNTMTFEDMDKINANFRPKKPDPNSIMEEKYSSAFTKYLDMQYHDQFIDNTNKNWSWADSFLGRATKEMPVETEYERNRAATATMYREFANTQKQNAEAKLEKQSMGGFLVDTAKQTFPFYNEVKMRGLMEDVSAIEGGGLGNNLYEQSRRLLQLPFDEYKAKFTKIMDKLNNDNPQLAVQFAGYVTGKSTSDQHLDNMFTLIDVAGVASGSLGIAKRLHTWNQVRTLYKQLVKSSEGSLDIPKVIEATGDIREAGVQKATANVLADKAGQKDAVKEAFEAIPKVLRTDLQEFAANPGSLSRETVNRITESTSNFIDKFTNIVANVARIERIPEAVATEKAMRAIVENDRRLYPGLANNIMDMSDPYKIPLATSRKYDMTLGATGTDIFVTKEQAEGFIRANGLLDAKIDPHGAGFVVKVSKNLNELSHIIRDGQIKTSDSMAPMSWANVMFGKFRTSEETLSRDQMMARKVATYGPAVLYKLAKENVAEIQKLSRGSIFRQDIVMQSKEIKGFKTAKGSEYTIQPDGTTVRNKALRNDPGHEGDQGLKPKSEKTVYVDEQSAAALAPTKGNWRMIDHEDGTLSMSTPSPGKGWGIAPSAKNIPFSTTPGVGKIPVELFSPGQTQGAVSFRNVHFGNKITELNRENLGVKRMSKGERFEEWRRIVDNSRREVDPDNPNLRGYFYRNPVELEQKYLQSVGRMPEEDEIAAYFAFKRQVELDRVFRNAGVYRNKASVGAESISFSMPNEDGTRTNSVRFDAVRKPNLPGGVDSILIARGKYGTEEVKGLAHLGGLREELDKNVKEGKGVVFEIYDPEARELRGFSDKVGNNRVRYVYAEMHDTKDISWDQVPRRGAGHFDYDYEHYIKQPIVHVEGKGTGAQVLRHIYEGDGNFMPVAQRAVGLDIAKYMNDITRLLKADKIDEAKALHTQAKLPWTWKEHKSWFDPQMVDGQLMPPRFSKDEDFAVVRAGQTINGMDNSIQRKYAGTFMDGTTEGSLARQRQVQYTGQRDSWDVMTVKDVGTAGNPVYVHEPAELVDPITTMNRGLKQIINSTYMDDYKMFSVEHWLRAAEPYLDLHNPNEARYAPFKHFNDPHFKSGTPPEIETQLMNQHFQIKQMWGIPSTLEANLHSFGQKLSDSIYRNYGPKIAEKLPIDAAISSIADPIAFMRKVTFHAKLGMFNPAQLFVQANTFASIFGIAGASKAAPGTMGAALHGLASLSKRENIIEYMDNLATKMRLPGAENWKPGWWKEAKETLDNIGFGHVGGEYASLNDMKHSLVTSMGAQILESGTIFFKGGEKSVRHGAWYTAYLELRSKEPLRVMDDAFAQKILDRADLLNNNMSRASNSLLNTGIMSLPSQFLTYTLRQAELFTSKRLTNLERARLFGTFSVLYGFPTALALTGFPAYDPIRNYALANGYNVDEKNLWSWVHEGIPSMMTKLATGDAYNVGERYGGGGFQTIGQALRGDTPFQDLVGGAAWTTLKNSFTATDGFRNAMMAMFTGDTSKYPLTPSDFVEPLQTITSFNKAWGTITALDTGKYFSTKGVFLSETTPGKAILNFITGLSTQNQADLNNLSMSRKDEKERFDFIQKQYVKEFNKMLRTRETNPDESDRYITRALSWLELLPTELRQRAMTAGYQGNEAMIERIQRLFYTDKVPDDLKNVRLDAYRKLLQQQGK